MHIGWVGTGIMGGSMAGRLTAAGHSVTVFTRTEARALPLVERGARLAASLKDACAGADIVFSMVGLPSENEEVFLGADGIVAHARSGALLVDMSTTSVAQTRAISEAAAVRGLRFVDAPVSGGDIGAKNGTLSIMIGGVEADVELLRPLFECLGSTLVHHGPVGAGQSAKLVNQILIAGNILAVCEGLVFARRAGLDGTALLRSVGAGAAGSWSIQNLAPRILRGDFDPGFLIEHFVKDLRLVLDECARLNLELPGVQLAERLYARLLDTGHGRRGIQALIFALDAEIANAN